MTPRIGAFSLVVLCGLIAHEGTAAAPVEERLQSGGRERSYEVYAPASPSGPPSPVVVLLHGSGGSGRHMLRLWMPLAEREGLVLVAPDSLENDAWRLRVDGPELFRDILDAVGVRHAIDPRRVYLFGQSGGAVYALTLALMESEYFAAVAVHGGAWREAANFTALRLAVRKIPVALFLGDLDEYFSLRSGRETERALREAGHPATLTVLHRRGHGYARVAAEVNAAAWRVFQPVVLPSEPRFIAY